MEIDPTGLQKPHDTKPSGTEGQVETQQGKELGGQAVTGQEPKRGARQPFLGQVRSRGIG